MSKDLARRDWFVDNAVKAAKSVGANVDAETVSRQAAKDLSLLDAAVAAGDVNAKTTPKEKKKPSPKGNAAQKKARQVGQKMWEKAPTTEDKPLEPLTGNDAIKQFAKEARIRILCKPIPGYRYQCDARGMIDEPLGNGCAYPRFANLLFMHSAGFARGIMSYKGLNYVDRMRKYNRAVEDILDQSDAAVGFNWYTK